MPVSDVSSEFFLRCSCCTTRFETIDTVKPESKNVLAFICWPVDDSRTTIFAIRMVCSSCAEEGNVALTVCCVDLRAEFIGEVSAGVRLAG